MLTASFVVSLFFVSSALQEPQQQTPPEQDAVVVYPSEQPKSVGTLAPVQARKRPKPKLILTCSPAISTAFVGGPGSLIECNVRVTNPDEHFWCPAVAWSFEDGFTPSSHEADCEPYDKVVSERGEPEYWSEEPKFFRLPSGTYQIWVKLLKANKVVARDFFIVQVH